MKGLRNKLARSKRKEQDNFSRLWAAVRHSIAATFLIVIAPAQSHVLADSLSAAPRYQRALNVGYRLQRGNAGFCPVLGQLTGWITHDIGAYDKDVRALVEARQKLGLGLGIAWVAPGGAADRAGLKAGDVVEAVGTTSLSSLYVDLVRDRASATRTDRLESWILTKMVSAPQILTVRRESDRLKVAMTAEQGCTGAVVVDSSSKGLAWSDERNVALTARLLSFLHSDDEIAFVIAHEMGHIWLREARVQRAAGYGGRLLSIDSRRISEESRADLVALTAMRQAGYAPEAAIGLLSRIARDDASHKGGPKAALQKRETVMKSTITEQTENGGRT
ncbi:M48 family metallopeptidase [Novosphingobium sp. SG707]|uniref:M48 family metallopeptidase n=1 Tax=Novosphingobium sp. SG707 TaxID=2586996 RepID=UPI001446D559|nr:M48 family metallopeptidase [Novosphingobium sp. SG707]NKJ00236.1 hypothetical protein [Novosphingobium sp. SG707]